MVLLQIPQPNTEKDSTYILAKYGIHRQALISIMSEQSNGTQISTSPSFIFKTVQNVLSFKAA
jgi:hypothetical protein